MKTFIGLLSCFVLLCGCTNPEKENGMTANTAKADGLGQSPAATGTLRPETLKVALLPDEDPASIIKENEAFAKYLEEKLSCSVELIVPHDYSVLIESMRAGRLHLAYFGPASYITCKDKGTEISPFAAKLKNGATTYQSVVVANPAEVSVLADVKGKAVGYGDPASTSSHLIPKSILLAAGLEPKRDYEQRFLGSHDAVALNVQSGSVAAGGMSAGIYEKLLAKKTISEDKVRIVYTSDNFPQYPWAWRNDLDPELKKEIQAAFINLKDEAILKALHAQGFAVIDDAAYDVVRVLEKSVAEYR